MLITASYKDFDPRDLDAPYEDRWGDPSRGVLTAWRSGALMRRSYVQRLLHARERGSSVDSGNEGSERGDDDGVSLDVQQRVEAGELPILTFAGGITPRPNLKMRKKKGSLFYLAMWKGLRGEDLEIDIGRTYVLKCARTGVEVHFARQ